MADLIEKTVTSYFHVKDVVDFKEAMEIFEKRVSYEEDAGKLRLSIHTGGWGAFDEDKNTDVSLLNILQTHLEVGQSCTLMSVAYMSKGDCILSAAGYAAVVTNAGMVELSLYDILEKAKDQLGVKASNPDLYS